jgi:hypothetical protein
MTSVTKRKMGSATFDLATAASVSAVVIYDPDTGTFTWLPRPVSARSARTDKAWNSRWAGKPAGYMRPDGYVAITVGDVPYLAHRLAWLLTHGEWPAEDIDHRDRNRSNNAISNLRVASRTENLRNSSIRNDNTSGVRGVWKRADYDCWVAEIMVEGKKVGLGHFRTKEEAIQARETGERRLFGEFSPLAASEAA